ncbi:MAG: uracil-DNA glycosylase [Chitinivibrionales bacterium]|nr:uracil-DNA glycosylase [Chitinivibrionales bacterium]MBD3396784.1 uracil-DNA glycosylase [Chitinivibrionales bacterium]
MPDTTRNAVQAYFRQQAELGMPGYIFGSDVLSGIQSGAAVPGTRPASLPGQPAGDSYEAKRRALVELYRATENCHNCPLDDTRTKYVFGAGNAEANLMIIGEAPGEDEDRQGVPFVGAAGQLLTKMLAAIDLDRRKDVFITNILKCRPPGNRNPSDAEAEACAGILARQIEIIAPAALLLLGRVAAHRLLGRTESLAKLRGEKLDYKGIPVVITYHPAALLRNPQWKRPAYEDLQRLQAMLKEP